jgi:hypothetical protein
VRSTRFLLPLARYRETDRRMDGQDGHWLRHPSHGDTGSSCFHTLKGMAGRGGCVCRRRVCSPVAYLGPETGRSRKDRAIVLLAALAMDGGSVALRATPLASKCTASTRGRRSFPLSQHASISARRVSSALFLLPIHSPPSAPALPAISDGRSRYLSFECGNQLASCSKPHFPHFVGPCP